MGYFNNSKETKKSDEGKFMDNLEDYIKEVVAKQVAEEIQKYMEANIPASCAESPEERNDKIYEEYLNGNMSYRELAREYGTSYENVKKIIYRRKHK